MGMYTHHYVGFYLKCSKAKKKKTDAWGLIGTMALSVIRIKTARYYIPNIPRDLCYHLDNTSDIGTLKVGRIELFPAWLEGSFDVLEHFYENVMPEYGILTYKP